MIWSSIVAGLLKTVAPKVADYYITKTQLKNDLEMETLRGKIEYEKAKTQRASESEGRDHEWEIESIRNSGWKDEWVLILLSIPLVLVFIPYTQPFVMDGFTTLDQTPGWYQWLILAVFSAVYGIRIWRRKP